MLMSSLAVMPAWSGASGDGPTVAVPGDHDMAAAPINHVPPGSQGFIENRGQFPDEDVAFYAFNGGIAFLPGAVLFNIEGPSHHHSTPPANPPHAHDAPPREDRRPQDIDGRSGCVVRLELMGAEGARPEGRGRLPGHFNYLIGSDPSLWHMDVPRFSEVVYKDLYPGIDLVYMMVAGCIKYEFIVNEEADPRAIRVHVEGATSLSVQGGKELRILTPAGSLRDDGLLVYYQDDPFSRVECNFDLLADDIYGFQVSARDPTRTLVIDPIVYATYLGGDMDDITTSIKVDGSGCAYICGHTDSVNFPTKAGAYNVSKNGGHDGFVTKLSADGRSLVFSTFIGGSGYDSTESLFVDEEGDVYLGGFTRSPDFPSTTGAFQTENGGSLWSWDGFVCKLSSMGNSLLYSTYFGGYENDYILAITADDMGCAYFTGHTATDNFTITDGAFQTTYGGGDTDAFVCKLNTTGAALVYLTYLGGTDSEEGKGIVLDPVGCAYVCGDTTSTGFPVTGGAFQTRMRGEVDAFVTKLRADGSDLVYSTHLGGRAIQRGNAIVLDPNKRAIVVGYTWSVDFPTTSGAYQTSLRSNDYDAFVTILSPDGTRLFASTLLGGELGDFAYGVDLDPDQTVLLCGWTLSRRFPTTPGAAQTTFGNINDGFASKLSADLKKLIYSTYLGGNQDDYAFGIVAMDTYRVYVGGCTRSTDFPVTSDAFQDRFGGGNSDGLIVKLVTDVIPPIADAGDDTVIDQHQTVRFNGTRSTDNVQLANWTWIFQYNGSEVELHGPDPNFTFDEAGCFAVTLTVLDVALLEGKDEANVTVRDTTPPRANAGSDRLIMQHERFYFDGTGSTDNVGIATYTWTFTYGGELVVLEGVGPSFVFDDAGTHDVELNVTDTEGNWATDAIRVHVVDTTPPRADAGVVAVVRQHDTVTFDGTGCRDNVGVVNFTWIFVYDGKPVTLYGPSPSFLFDLAGRYTVTLTVSDRAGNTASEEAAIEVLDTTPPTADAGADVSILQGQKVGFDGRGSSDNVAITSWTWQFDYAGASIKLKGATPEFLFGEAGTYIVTLTLMDNEGNEAEDRVTVNVRDTEPPTAEAGPDIHICQQQEVTLDGFRCFDNVGIANWTWAFSYRGVGVSLYGQSSSFIFDDAGMYEVRLTVTDAEGNRATDSLNVTVRDIMLPVAIAGPDRSVDQGQPVSLDGSGSSDNVGVTRYMWSFERGGDIEELAERNVQFTFDVPGDYTVTLTVQDSAGNTASASFDLNVRDIIRPTPPSISTLAVRVGETVTLDASGATDNVGVVGWLWSFEEGGETVTLEGMQVEHVFDEAGEYDVTLTVMDADGNEATETFSVTVSGGSWMWALIAVVVVAVALVAVVLMRRSRG